MIVNSQFTSWHFEINHFETRTDKNWNSKELTFMTQANELVILWIVLTVLFWIVSYIRLNFDFWIQIPNSNWNENEPRHEQWTMLKWIYHLYVCHVFQRVLVNMHESFRFSNIRFSLANGTPAPELTEKLLQWEVWKGKGEILLSFFIILFAVTRHFIYFQQFTQWKMTFLRIHRQRLLYYIVVIIRPWSIWVLCSLFRTSSLYSSWFNRLIIRYYDCGVHFIEWMECNI